LSAPHCGGMRTSRSAQQDRNGPIDESVLTTLQDLVTGDEIVSDGYPMKEIDDVVYEIECKKISKGTEDNFGACCRIEESRAATDGRQTLELIPQPRRPRRVSRATP
jgi:hypothetical protein